MQSKLGTTVTRLIMDEQRKHHPEARGEFSLLMVELIVAIQQIASNVNKAGLLNILGAAGTSNIQDEEQQKLDVFADEAIIKAMEHTGRLCGMASEEQEEMIQIPVEFPKGKYILVFDPLDGSSNIDVNVSIGTIFGIYRRTSESGEDATAEDFRQPGSEQVAAGYAIYGSSTMLVLATKNGVNGFTLDPAVGEFILSHPHMTMPEQGRVYSINEGNSCWWDENTEKMVEYFKTEDKATKRPYSGRYIGSLVADFHRNLLYGGVFMYPADGKDKNKTGGKLRLLYEAAPLAFVAEIAGGAATDGKQRILDIVSEGLHDRLPLIIGNKSDVEMATNILQGKI